MNWVDMVEEKERCCANCKYLCFDDNDEPCAHCCHGGLNRDKYGNQFEPDYDVIDELKTCDNCVHDPAAEPETCARCKRFDRLDDNWEES